MTLRATDYVILRGVETSCLKKIPMERQPIRVATLLSEEKFEATGHEMEHFQTVFFEDKLHDWDWRGGDFRFYSRVDDRCDVLVVYAEEEVPPKFCAQTGKPL